MTEILNKSVVSSMQSFVDELVQQATEAGMIVNGRKTKELPFGSILKDPPLFATLKGTTVERVWLLNVINQLLLLFRQDRP